MKPIKKLLFGCALMAALHWASPLFAQDLVINTFDTAGEVTAWSRWWGIDPQLLEFDATADANEDPSSGAMKLTVDFDLATHGGDNQFSIYNTAITPAINGLNYESLEMDIIVAGSSPLRPAGDHGWLEYGFWFISDYGQNDFGKIGIPITNNWIHLSVPIPLDDDRISEVSGIHIKMWGGSGNDMTGTFVMWIDNIILKGSGEPPPPPTLSIEPTGEPGLQLTASAPGSEFQRQCVRTTDSGYSFVPVLFDPVTYEFEVQSFPDTNYPGFQTHMFLVPDRGDLPYGIGDTSIDWNAPHCIFVHVQRNDDGSGFGRFMYKTNQPSGNTMLWNDNPANGPAGTLASLWSPSPLGTWSVTFDNDGDLITLTEPTGTSTNFPMLSAETKAIFNEPLYVYFGVQPNNGANNIGQETMLSRIKIDSFDPSFPSFEDTFTSAILDPRWTVVAVDPAGVAVLPPDAALWVLWTLPDIGFQLQSTTTLSPPTWSDFTPATTIQIGLQKKGLLTEGILPGGNAFFRMIQP